MIDTKPLRDGSVYQLHPVFCLVFMPAGLHWYRLGYRWLPSELGRYGGQQHLDSLTITNAVLRDLRYERWDACSP